MLNLAVFGERRAGSNGLGPEPGGCGEVFGVVTNLRRGETFGMVFKKGTAKSWRCQTDRDA